MHEQAEAEFENESEREPKDANASELTSRLGMKTRNQDIRNNRDAGDEQHSADELGGRIAKLREENCLAKRAVHDGEDENA